MPIEIATFGAGCFWGVEETFRKIPGILETMVGYSGGDLKEPSYQDVCQNETGHAEVVTLTYDTNQITYQQLLDIFWESHDPTQLNRQGFDTGTQYRSIILYHTPEQKKLAEVSKQTLETSGKFDQPIVTEIVSAGPFYRAEEYHQKYLYKQNMATCNTKKELP